MLDSNLLLVLSIGALLVVNGLIARAAASKEGEPASEKPTTGDRPLP